MALKPSAAYRCRTEWTDTELLESVIAFYRERLKEHPPALEYLQIEVSPIRRCSVPSSSASPTGHSAGRCRTRNLPRASPSAGSCSDSASTAPPATANSMGASPCQSAPMREVVQLYGRKIARHLNDRNTLHVTMAAECFRRRGRRIAQRPCAASDRRSHPDRFGDERPYVLVGRTAKRHGNVARRWFLPRNTSMPSRHPRSAAC